MSKINIENVNDVENVEEPESAGEIEIPGAGQWGVPFEKVDAAFDLIIDRYKCLVDETYLQGFLADIYFFAITEDSETHGMDIEEYFENALRSHNRDNNSPKMPGFGMLSAILG